MKIEQIKSRNVLFTDSIPAGWDLNVQLIIGNKYNYIIDTGLGSLSVEPIKKYLEGNDKPIIVINTHYHWDHIWGNSSLQNCVIISHKLCSEMIKLYWGEMIQKNNMYIKGDAKMCLPNMTFENELYFPEDKIRIIYTPGHTIDSISVIDEIDKVINVGDNIGDTIDDIIPSLKCEKEQYIDTLLKYKKIDFDLCVSGHNIVLDKEVIEIILSMLDIKA